MHSWVWSICNDLSMLPRMQVIYYFTVYSCHLLTIYLTNAIRFTHIWLTSLLCDIKHNRSATGTIKIYICRHMSVLGWRAISVWNVLNLHGFRWADDCIFTLWIRFLSKPAVGTETARSSFNQAAPSVWNSLTVEIRISETISHSHSYILTTLNLL